MYTHTGWIQRGKWYYLTYGGALGENGQDTSVVLDVGPIQALRQYELPEPDPYTVVDDFNALMELVDSLGPATITYPFVSTVFRTPLCHCEAIGYTLYYVGRTGVWKSTIVALAFSFFGRKFTYKNLLSVKISTTGAAEKLQHLLKDMPIVFDDMVLTGERGNDAKLKNAQDAFFRGSSDGVTRHRLDRGSELLHENAPQGSSWGTGETPPSQESAIARAIINRLTKGSINRAVLSKAQDDAKSGRWARLMASSNQWNAPQMDELNETIPALHDTLLHNDEIAQLFGGKHSRTAPSLIRMLCWF